MAQSYKAPKKRVVILGGGFAGLTLAQEFDAHIDSGNEANLSVTLIDRGGAKIIGAAYQFVLADRNTREEVTDQLKIDSLKLTHVSLVIGEITAINLENKQIITAGNVVKYDVLVIGLGVDTYAEFVPGLKEGSHDICSMDDVLTFKEKLKHFNGGKIVVSVARLPYKCPPAPHEFSYVIHDILLKRGLREKTELIFVTPMSSAVPPPNPKPNQKLMDECKISCFYDWKMTEVDNKSKNIMFENGKNISFDLMASIFPQKAAKVLRNTPGLCNEEGWISVDGRTLRTQISNVYALGDNAAHRVIFTGNKEFGHPKAGGFAEVQARYVAKTIIADALSENLTDWEKPPLEMSESGKCVLEGPGDTGFEIDIDFFSNPDKPIFQVSDPQAGLVKDKMEWVDEHRKKWFK